MTIRKHGHARKLDGGNSREYRAWTEMKRRCLQSKSTGFKWYGERGIKICSEWIADFGQFLKDMGPCPADLELERIDNEGNYEPGNCRWATRKEQNRNRRNNHKITHDGQTLCLIDWAKKVGLHKDTLRKRLEHGWSVEEALTIPVASARGRFASRTRREDTHGA